MREFDQDYSANEQPKAPYYTESLEDERRAVVEAFYDHVIAYTSTCDDDLTVESILSEDSETPREYDAGTYEQLTELVSVDIRHHRRLSSGEMRVSGRGVYVSVTDENPSAPSSDLLPLDVGEALHGTIADYRAMSVLSYGAFEHLERSDYRVEQEDDEVPEEPAGLCVILENVEQLDMSGRPVATHDWALVPLTYDSLLFEKVIRQEFMRQPLMEILAGDDMKDHCRDIENDLNYNEYRDDVCRQRHDMHLDDLYRRTQELEYQLLSVSALGTNIGTGEQLLLDGDKVEYGRPVIVRHGEYWRVVHSVSLIDQHDQSALPLHINPEDITNVTREEAEY